MPDTLNILEFGLDTPYNTVRELQLKLIDEIAVTHRPHLILCEHPHVITVGKREKSEQHPDSIAGIPVIQIERGGALTYHGPGQLVAYPLLYMGEGNRDLHGLLRDFEEVVIRTLAAFTITAGRNEKLTGVWVGQRKIASIGIAIKRWVTYHGLALNVSTDLSRFQAIRPCGMDASVMTSMESLLERNVPMADVKRELIRTFRDVRKF